jgi:tetratricopeptide (TPR) repeat protein
MLPEKAFEIVHRYADKALAIDPTVAEGYIAKASAYMFYDWKWQEAYSELQKAIELNPGAIEAYDLLGIYYISTGQTAEAVRLLETAERLDPLSPVVLQSLGNMYIFADRYDDAIRQADKILEMDPRMRISIEMKGWATGMKGDWEASLPYFEEVHRLTNHPLKGLMGLGFAYATLGRRDEALDIIRKMEQRQEEEPDSVLDADIAAVWYGLNDLDKTFYYLDRCVEKRMGPICFFLEYPAYRGIKDDQRYPELRKKTGL